MVDNRVIQMSAQGYKALVNPEEGRGLNWTTDILEELPIKMKSSGPGSERPFTMPQLFMNAVKSGNDRQAMFVERKGKIQTWTWKEYYTDAMYFAKSMAHLGVKERSAVAIMGFNSPEWAIGFIGGILHNCVNTGIYSTNAPDAVLYQADHSEAEVVLCESNDHLKRFLVNLDKLPKIKAFVVYGETALPEGCSGNRFYLWSDFLRLGQKQTDNVIFEKMGKQKPGECCCLIYTSGTTGNPKGCMLSHDNLVWQTIAVMEVVSKDKPDFAGPHNRVVSYLPLSHIAGLCFDVLSHYFNVSELYFARPDALQGTLVETLKWARPTTFFAVPRIWEKFEDKLKEIASTKPKILQNISGWAKGYGTAHTQALLNKTEPPMMYSVANFLILSQIKTQLGLDQCIAFFFGAAPLKKTSVEYFASLDMPLFNLYGMSETTGAFTLHTFAKFNLDSCGYTLPGCDLRIDNPDEKGEGEICMRGRNIMMGYLKNPQATKDTLDPNGYLKSGDKGRVDEQGFLRITGRIKELIITAGGENIAPVPVEDNFKLMCPPCANIMMLGEQQRFMAALITFKVDIDMKTGVPSKNLMTEARTFFKDKLGVDVKTTDEAIAEPKISEFVKKCIEETNKKSVSRAAHIRKFKLLPEDFSIPGGELTPTMKLKRKVTEKKYQKFVDEMFEVAPKL